MSYFNSDLPPVYPNAWIPVAYSSAIKNDQKIHESILCGHDIILFRDENSTIACLDAYCPHLGANLAAGGRLTTHKNETCVTCPFHGWSFNRNGDCVDIPYNCSKGTLFRCFTDFCDCQVASRATLKTVCCPEIPKGTSVRNYRVEERNGFVYVWYHADDEPPNWLPEAIEEIQTNQWTFMGQTEHIVSCHFQEIPENGRRMVLFCYCHHSDSLINSTCSLH